jgi:hypothetical protein
LYGTTSSYSVPGFGTVFSLTFRPQLAITRSGMDVILTWPTNNGGFDYSQYILQSTTDLNAPTWTTVAPAPVAVNGQNTVTNAADTQKFYRLIR